MDSYSGLYYYADYNERFKAVSIFLKTHNSYVECLLEDKPYFYIPYDPAVHKSLATLSFRYRGRTIRPAKVEAVEALDMGVKRKFLKVSVDHPDDRRLIERRLKVKGREVDFPEWQQIAQDYNLTPFNNVKVTGSMQGGVVRVKEIEVVGEGDPESLKPLYFYYIPYSKRGYPKPEEDPILVIAYYFDGEKGLLKANGLNDKQLVENFISMVKRLDPDILVSHSQDSEFFPHLLTRARIHGVSVDIGRDGSEPLETGKYFRGMILKEYVIRGRINFDIFPVAWRDFPELPTKSIGEICAKLGLEEPEIIPLHKVSQYLKSSPEMIERSAMEGLDAIVRVSEKLLPFQYQLSRLTLLPLHQQIRTTVGDLVEAKVSYEMKRRGWVQPRRPSKRVASYYLGGLVWLKEPGVYENVGYLDFRSMYPSIIVKYNISAETVDPPEGLCKDGVELVEVGNVRHKVCKTVKGLIAGIVEELMETRFKLKDKLKSLKEGTPEYRRIDAMQHAVKVIANASYGYMGWTTSLMYDKSAAELITALGRKFIEDVRNYVEEKGYTPIYMDTDGIQIIGGSEEEYLKLVDMINRDFPLIIEYEYTARRAVYFTKKKYAHMIDGKIIAKGFEFIRKDYPKIVKDAQREAITIILKGGSVDDAREAYNRYIEKLKKGDVTIEDLTITEQLGKKLGEFERLTKASAAAMWLLEKEGIEIHRGQNINIVIIKGGGGINERARPAEFYDVQDCDLNYYIQLLIQVMERDLQKLKHQI